MDPASFASSLLEGPCFGDMPSSQSSTASSPTQVAAVTKAIDQQDIAASTPELSSLSVQLAILPQVVQILPPDSEKQTNVATMPQTQFLENVATEPEQCQPEPAHNLESELFIQQDKTCFDTENAPSSPSYPSFAFTPTHSLQETQLNDSSFNAEPIFPIESQTMPPSRSISESTCSPPDSALCEETDESQSRGDYTSAHAPSRTLNFRPTQLDDDSLYNPEYILSTETQAMPTSKTANELTCSSLCEETDDPQSRGDNPLTSSPPSSSPPALFSSSPLQMSDSSVFEVPEECVNSQTFSLEDVRSDEVLDLNSEDHLQDLHDDDEGTTTQNEFIDLPPSSSPFRSSSPVAGVETDDDLSLSTEANDLPSKLEALLHNHPMEEILTQEEKPEAAELKTSSESIAPTPPHTKRLSATSQKSQRKLLTKPFRPLTIIKKPKVSELPPTVPPAKQEPVPQVMPAQVMPGMDMKKHRTQRASAQFKSPLPSSVSSSLSSSVRQTPTIQLLERRLQVLRRAVKLQQDGEEDILQGLAAKWTEAGREIAWEVWGLVKDNEASSSESGKRKLDDSWGWGDDNNSKKVKVEERERNWGWSTTPTEEEHPPESTEMADADEDIQPKETMGSMLLRMGIALETLGWNEEEGEFVDDD